MSRLGVRVEVTVCIENAMLRISETNKVAIMVSVAVAVVVVGAGADAFG